MYFIIKRFVRNSFWKEGRGAVSYLEFFNGFREDTGKPVGVFNKMSTDGSQALEDYGIDLFDFHATVYFSPLKAQTEARRYEKLLREYQPELYGDIELLVVSEETIRKIVSEDEAYWEKVRAEKATG